MRGAAGAAAPVPATLWYYPWSRLSHIRLNTATARMLACSHVHASAKSRNSWEGRSLQHIEVSNAAPSMACPSKLCASATQQKLGPDISVTCRCFEQISGWHVAGQPGMLFLGSQGANSQLLLLEPRLLQLAREPDAATDTAGQPHDLLMHDPAFLDSPAPVHAALLLQDPPGQQTATVCAACVSHAVACALYSHHASLM